MTSEEQPAGPSSASSARPQRSGPLRRRRGFRPSRRPRRPSPAPESPAQAQDAQREAMESPEAEAVEPTESFEASERSDHPETEEAELEPAAPAEPVTQRSEGSGRRADAAPAIRQAIEEVQKINRDLESLLLEMEKALETLEEAEVQKYAEEREIEALRTAVRQLNRARESVQRPSQQQGRLENRSRHSSHREDRYRGRPPHRQGQRPPQRSAGPAAPSEHHSIDQPPSQEEPRPDTPHEPESPF